LDIFLSYCAAKILVMSAGGKTRLWHRVRSALDGYSAGIVPLIAESYGTDTIQHAWMEFRIGNEDSFNCEDPNTELFFSWLFHCWSPTREKGNRVADSSLYGVQPTRAYLDRYSKQLDPLLRSYLENCLVTSAEFYEVFNCEPYIGFRARNLMTGSEYEVSEALASKSLANGDIMFGHLVPLEGTTMLEAISPRSFPPVLKSHVVRLCQSQTQSLRPELPTFEMRELYFLLADPPQARPKLS
jgi:hypothetical protein